MNLNSGELGEAKMKEKRKWQIAFRRYVLEGSPSEAYAPYFGIDRVNLRKWFELQFKGSLSWESFATKWQFDHIVPVAYFDFKKEDDLYLCWNFTNIRIESISLNKNRVDRIDVLSVKKYFSDLYKQTEYSTCQKMVEKIEQIEKNNMESNNELVSFLTNNKKWLEQVSELNKDEFSRYNSGIALSDLFLEREILKKFG